MLVRRRLCADGGFRPHQRERGAAGRVLGVVYFFGFQVSKLLGMFLCFSKLAAEAVLQSVWSRCPMAKSWLSCTDRMVLGAVLVWVVGCGWSDGSWLVVFWGWVVQLERFQCGFLIREQWNLGLDEIGGGIFANPGDETRKILRN